MISLKDLKREDVGRWVKYSSFNRFEKGKIKSWNDKFVFVVYKCGDQWEKYEEYTAAATLPQDLDWI